VRVTARYVGQSAVEIARGVRGGEFSARDVVAEHLGHIAAHDGAVGAFRTVLTERALAEAEAVDARADRAALPLAGVPVAIKDNLAVAGEPTLDGSRGSSEVPAERDHELVARLRAAGAVVVGITRLPELSTWGTTDDADGVSRNPWDLGHTSGGSSGGAGAAVAAGFVPIAQGNDAMGSIRIPAACCGVVGIKPGTGVVPAGIGVNGWFGMSENGPLATTVADAVLALDVMAGRPEGSSRQEVHRRLRVAVSHRSPVLGVLPDRDARDGLHRAARALVAAGHDAHTAGPPYPMAVLRSALARWVGGVAVDAEQLEDMSLLQPRTRRHVALGRQAIDRGLIREADRAVWQEAVGEMFGRYDVLLTPTLAGPPPEAHRWSQRSWLANLSANARFAPYAAPWNLAGVPAMSVPAGIRSDGLPAAVQLVGAPGSEALLLAVAAQLEAALPWQRHPGVEALRTA
jgi:amidase